MFKLELGVKAKDCVTGFGGIVTARAEFISGCRQYSLTAKAADGKAGETQWFDEDRVTSKKVQDMPRVAEKRPDQSPTKGGPEFTPRG